MSSFHIYINSILEYTNNGIRDIILYYFDSINDIDISINELIKSSFLTKLPKDLKIFIIIDQQAITDIGNKICFRYYYHNKNITTIDNNILEIEKYPTNLYILGWYTNEHNKSPFIKIKSFLHFPNHFYHFYNLYLFYNFF